MARVELVQLTDCGPVRSGNEDAIGSWECDDGIVFAVADGLGGRGGGEVASRLAIEILESSFKDAPEKWPTAKKLRRAVQDANLRIYNMGITVPELRGMATTLTATAVVGSSLVTAHVGDCRLLRLRDGKLTQLTKDHSWVAEQVQYGLLSPSQARVHPKRNLVTRSLGKELIVSIDIVSTEVCDGDALLQCSDGVHALLEENDLASVLREHAPDAACRLLIEQAIAAGGKDNLSAQIAIVSDCAPGPVPKRSWWNIRRRTG
jgi:PPM family protein phosphatase